MGTTHIGLSPSTPLLNWSTSTPQTTQPTKPLNPLFFGCSNSNSMAFVDCVCSNWQKNEFLNKAIHHSFLLFMSPIWSVPPKSNDGESDVTKKCKYDRIHHLLHLLLICLFVFLPVTNGRVENHSWCMSFVHMACFVAGTVGMGNILRAMTQRGSRVAC